MTTVAYKHKDGTLSVDSQITTTSYVISPINVPKIVRVEGVGGNLNGWLGVCGDMAAIGDLVSLLEGKDLGSSASNLEVQAIFMPDGSGAFEVEISSIGTPALHKINSDQAIGSGRQLALGAMFQGASSSEAVSAAKKYDIYTGGRIITKKRGAKK